MNEIRATDPQLLLDRIEDLPALSPVVSRVLGLINNDDSTARQIAEFVQNDTALTLRILKVVNSAYYGFSHRVSTVSQAVVLLGHDTIKSIVLSTNVIEMMVQNTGTIADLKRLWERSLFAAVAGRKLARMVGYAAPEEVFMACLMMDVGMLVQLRIHGEAYGEILARDVRQGEDILVIEGSQLDFSHEVMGEAVMRRWGLPEVLTRPILYHHQLRDVGREEPDMRRLCQLVHLARLAGRIFYSPKVGMALTDFRRESRVLVQMDPDAVDDFFRGIKEEVLEVAAQYGFEIRNLPSYTELLDEANQELADLNQTYERMNRELQQAKQEAEELALKLRDANEILQQLANHDALTGLYNRRYFDDFIKREFERSRRYTRTLAFILIDIDHFKSVNDNYGHQMGDTVLREMGELLRALIRGSDMAARYGGEEMVVILPETNLYAARIAAEKVRRAVEKYEFPWRPREPLKVTISMGLACHDEHSPFESADQLIARADECLYRAKHEGRNRICF
jgi:two-component system cell cycle response regulator